MWKEFTELMESVVKTGNFDPPSPDKTLKSRPTANRGMIFAYAKILPSGMVRKTAHNFTI
jgi:hypothetical protein